MMDWLLFTILFGVIMGVLYVLYSGLFSNITILTGRPPIKKIIFAYKFKQGPYKDCGQLFKESHCIAPSLPCIGVYYDDPKEVPGHLCRYAVGSILTEGDNKADEKLLKRYETSGFKVFSFPEVTNAVTTSFPYRTALSILLGVKRVYPQLGDYIKKRKLCAHPFLEIYREDQILYMGPLARQGDFYVPEACEVKRRLSGVPSSDTDISDSHSECSSGSGVLLSNSRESSLAASSGHSEPL